MPPTRVGPYEILAELARGGMGVVYRARDPQLGREVALKVLVDPRQADARLLSRFRREGQSLARLKHPNIVGVLAAGEEHGRPWLAMELVAGVNLEDHLEQGGPLDDRAAAELARSLARALAYTHEQGVLHRDLKPGNVLLDASGAPRLADFGLARALDPSLSLSGVRLSKEGHGLGSPAYWSPEQATGNLEAMDAKTDVYGLGAVLFALLTGRPPHEPQSMLQALALTLEPVQPPHRVRPGVSIALSKICSRCLEVSPRDRFPDMQSLTEALDAFLDSPPAQAPRRAKRVSERVAGAPEGLVGKVLGARIPRVVIPLVILVVTIGWAVRTLRPPAPMDPRLVKIPRQSPSRSLPPPPPATLPLPPASATPTQRLEVAAKFTVLEPPALRRRPVPWSFPRRELWTTARESLVLRTRADAGPLTVMTGDERALPVAIHAGRAECRLPLGPGNNAFRVTYMGETRALMVLRTEPTTAKTFKLLWSNTGEVEVREGLVHRLDPRDPDQLELLLEFAFKRQDWVYREAAIDVLAGEDAPTLEALVTQQTDPIILEAVLQACGRTGDVRLLPHLLPHLAAKKWVVTRAAAIALGELEDTRALPELVAAWRTAEDQREIRTLRASVIHLSGQTDLRQPPPAEIPGQLSEPGLLLENHRVTPDRQRWSVTVNGFTFNLRVRGTPDLEALDLIVLSDLGFSSDMIAPYMEAIERERVVVYVELPGREGWANSSDLAYPLRPVAEALHDLRLELESTRILSGRPLAIMSQGVSGWFSMIMAATHPRTVRRQILIAPFSGTKALSEGVDALDRRGKQTGDATMERYALEGIDPLLMTEGSRELARKGFTLQFADTRDTGIGRVLGAWLEDEERWAIQRPLGLLSLPEFSVFREKRSQTPTVILYGALDSLSSADDCKALARHYRPNAKVLTFRRSARAPWIEEEEKTQEVLIKFLGPPAEGR